MTDNQQVSHLPPGRKPLWRRGLLLGLGLAFLGLLVWFGLYGMPVAPTGKQGEATPPAESPPAQSPPAESSVVLQGQEQSTAKLITQLEQVIAGIREANQKKDLPQLLSHYSPNFPQLTQRARSISKAWKIYDYPKMTFEIKDVKLLAENTAVARVTWDTEVRNISTQKSQNISKTYVTRFVMEAGQWRIKALEEAE